MNCSQCRGIEIHFDTGRAQDEVAAYRQNGPDETTRRLIDALVAQGIDGASLLDIGGGVGVIQHELLEAGVERAVSVEASSAYLEAAEEEAARRGYSERIQVYHGNFVDLATSVPPADIVTLDRVVCCYHDVHALVRLSSERARRLYGLVYPRDTWWTKVAIPVRNVGFWLQRSPFRVYVHPTETVDALVRESGFEPCYRNTTLFWQIVVYRRVGAA